MRIWYYFSLKTLTDSKVRASKDHGGPLWIFVLMSHIKDHFILRRMQFAGAQYLFSFQNYLCSFGIEKLPKIAV